MPSRSFTKMRKEFQKARHDALSEKRKGTRWRKKSAWLFCEEEGVFIDTFFIGHGHREKTSVLVKAKPMAIDPLFWSMTGMPENEQSPLSLRANGAFVCTGVQIFEKIIDDEGRDPFESAAAILALAEEGADAALRSMKDQPFSRVLEADATARDVIVGESNAPTYVTALILDRRYSDARQFLSMIASGKLRPRSSFGFARPDGTSADFFDLAAAYIDSQAG